VNVEMTEERLRDLMATCDHTQNEVISVACGYSIRDEGDIHLLFIPQPQRPDNAFRAGLYTREEGRYSSVRHSPQMHVSPQDVVWFLPLIRSFLRTHSGEIPHEEAS
jgi:hypothetical protein